MFPYRSDAPLVVGRLITYAVGETAAGDEFEIDLDHLGQRAYAPGEGDFRTDSARPVADPLLWADSRWRKFAETLWNGRAEYAEHDARQMCARAERLWRAGKLPGPPDLVAMYRVEYDLPRENGAAAVAVEANRLELIRLTNASGARSLHWLVERAGGGRASRASSSPSGSPSGRARRGGRWRTSR